MTTNAFKNGLRIRRIYVVELLPTGVLPRILALPLHAHAHFLTIYTFHPQLIRSARCGYCKHLRVSRGRRFDAGGSSGAAEAKGKYKYTQQQFLMRP